MSKSEQVTTDPKFVPAAAQLSSVGLKVGDIRSDDQLYELVRNNRERSDLIEAQNAVATYVLWKRGAEQEAIAGKVGVDVRTVKRWVVQGVAILRTGEYTRTLGAVKLVDMSKAAVDEATQGDFTAAEKLDRLERAALAMDIKSKFETDGKKAVSDDTISAIVDQLPAIVQENAEPVTAKNMANSVHIVADRHKITRKTRTPDQDGSGNQVPEVHLKAALRDVRAIVKDNDGAVYVPTPQDLKALLALVNYLLPDSDLNAEITAAIDAVAEVM